MINRFAGQYEFLSNFYNAPVMHQGVFFNNSEAAFQAAKVYTTSHDEDIFERSKFTAVAPNIAKRMGRKVKLRPDWEEVKDGVMYDILKDKFTRNPELKQMLLATGTEELVEGNYWHDNYWGKCSCERCANKPGQNTLGKLLMKVRSELAE